MTRSGTNHQLTHLSLTENPIQPDRLADIDQLISINQSFLHSKRECRKFKRLMLPHLFTENEPAREKKEILGYLLPFPSESSLPTSRQLSQSCAINDIEKVESLLDAGIELNQPIPNRQPCEFHRSEIVALLLERGASPVIRSAGGHTHRIATLPPSSASLTVYTGLIQPASINPIAVDGCNL